MIRLGLCCIFKKEPIKFRTTTATACAKLNHADRLTKLAGLCSSNADALLAALQYCAGHEIGCFRINSQILPLKTHPQLGYEIEELPEGNAIRERFLECGRFARQNDIRTVFHPDQFVVLNSPKQNVVASSLAELEYQAEVADWVGADVVNIHGGGAYGDKPAALEAFRRNLDQLSDRARCKLTVENDDRIFSPGDLLPLCEAEGLPLVYDVHHHRCHRDELTEREATQRAIATWEREPLFHLSSPLNGWQGPNPERHHDFIHLRDFPPFWEELNITVEVEAKAKELAVKRLHQALKRRVRRRSK